GQGLPGLVGLPHLQACQWQGQPVLGASLNVLNSAERATVCKLCRYHRHFLKWYLPRKGCWAGHDSPTLLMAREHETARDSISSPLPRREPWEGGVPSVARARSFVPSGDISRRCRAPADRTPPAAWSSRQSR